MRPKNTNAGYFFVNFYIRQQWVHFQQAFLLAEDPLLVLLRIREIFWQENVKALELEEVGCY